MAGSSGPSFADYKYRPQQVERRKLAVRTVKRGQFGRPFDVAICPFCEMEKPVRAKALAGGGTRCECGALFTHRREALHWGGDHAAALKLIEYLEQSL